MKDLFESILDDEEDVLNKADDSVAKEAGRSWLADHGFKSRRYEGKEDGPEGQHGWVDDIGEIYLTKKDTERSIPGVIPTVLRCARLFIKGYEGKTIPQRIIPSHTSTVMISGCPNLEELPKLPEEVDTFSVINCPKLKSLDGCPKNANKLFKVDNCGKEFDWKDIHKACPGVKKQNVIY